MQIYDVVIVGAGASGILCAYHLSRLNPGPSVLVIEAAQSIGGTAYARSGPACLLNVPHWGMTALPEQPDSFSHFVDANHLPLVDGAFARRQDYLSYLKDLFTEALQAPHISYSQGCVEQLSSAPANWIVNVKMGNVREDVGGRAIVLALGNESPQPLPAQENYPITIENNPWDPEALTRIIKAKNIFILGTGLTALDQIAELTARGYLGRFHLISRRGKLPLPHDIKPALSYALPERALSPLTAFRFLRDLSKEHPWRRVIDGLRPHTSQIWRSWDDRKRKQFLRHLRSHWDIRRHRVAPSIIKLVDELRSTERLTIRNGRCSNGQIKFRGDIPEASHLEDAVLINCTGPSGPQSNELVSNLVSKGYVMLDTNRLGLRSNMPDSYQLKGQYSSRTPLYTLGPLLKGDLWESIAMPEIRVQAPALVKELISKLAN